MNLDAAFAQIAQAFSAAGVGPYVDGQVLTTTDAVMDGGGSIATPGTVTRRDCRVQIDSVAEAMRPESWTDKDYRFLILAATLQGDLDTDATVEVLAGPNTGKWLVSSLQRDPAGIGWTGRGRRA